MTIVPFRFTGRRLEILDQTLLPEQEEWIDIPDAAAMVTAIARLQVRGAPAIGIAAALSLAQEASREGRPADRMVALEEAGLRLIASRPTAVNLGWAVNRVLSRAKVALRAQHTVQGPARWSDAVRAEALAIWEEDRTASRAMAENGAEFFPTQRRFLTHCNTGGLATGGGGTALGVLLELNRRREGGIEVWATETRPLLQGARLTAWELVRAGVPTRLIADGAATHVILREGIEGVLVGADRVARNGDTANKIGTMGLALAAREAGIPFAVVAPFSSIDPSTVDGRGIIIEERGPSEVTQFRGVQVAPEGVTARNPAFDVTPAEWISAIVTERGTFRGPVYAFGVG